MRRKTAIGVMAITVVAMPAALFALATVVMWPNSTFEELLFETTDSPMMTHKVVLQRLNAQGYGEHAASFAGVWTEAQFEARLADIKRRYKRKDFQDKYEGGGSNLVGPDWRSSLLRAAPRIPRRRESWR
jgi:hypothetical protein